MKNGVTRRTFFSFTVLLLSFSLVAWPRAGTGAAAAGSARAATGDGEEATRSARAKEEGRGSGGGPELSSSGPFVSPIRRPTKAGDVGTLVGLLLFVNRIKKMG